MKPSVRHSDTNHSKQLSLVTQTYSGICVRSFGRSGYSEGIGHGKAKTHTRRRPGGCHSDPDDGVWRRLARDGADDCVEYAGSCEEEGGDDLGKSCEHNGVLSSGV